MWGIWRKTVLLQKECEWGRQTMHKWLVGFSVVNVNRFVWLKNCQSQ